MKSFLSMNTFAVFDVLIIFWFDVELENVCLADFFVQKINISNDFDGWWWCLVDPVNWNPLVLMTQDI